MTKTVKLMVAALLASVAPAWAQEVPAGYPAAYADIIAGAKQEGKVSIYTTTNVGEMTDMLNAFKAKYPGVEVEYLDTGSAQMYSRFIAETGSGSSSADIVWASSMDLILKLAEDGYGANYESPEAANVPDWGKWGSPPNVYAITAEPLLVAYNKRLVPEGEIPQTREDIIKLLEEKPDQYNGKITMQDTSVGFGYLLFSQDMAKDPELTRRFVKTIAQSGGNFELSSGATIERIVSGENTIAYNVIGSYLNQRQKDDPNIGSVFLRDYTTVISRLMMISKTATNPKAARLFLDFLLSKEGQGELCKRSMTSVRPDMASDPACQINGSQGVPAEVFATLQKDALLATLDEAKRLELLDEWKVLTQR